MSGGVEILPRTARSIVTAVLAGFACVYGLAALAVPGGVPKAVAGCGVAVTVVALQLFYVLPAWRRARGRWLLPVQVAAGYLAILGFGLSMGILGFLAGSLLLRRRVVWALAVLASAVIVVWVRSGLGLSSATSVVSLLISLVVYGLTRLAERVEETAATRLALAMSAVQEERLRIAARLAQTLGADLDRIQAIREPAQVAEVLDTTRRSLAAARATASDLRSLSLGPEATAARALLESAGIEPAVRVGHAEPLGAAGALLAEVLREAVTDVVRQGTAKRCTITTAERDGRVVLRIGNDGVVTAAQGAERLRDLTERVTDAGGRLTTGLDPFGRFVVEASVVASPPPPDPAARLAYRPSLILLALVLAGFSVAAVVQLSPRAMPVAAALAAVICWLQFRWVRSPNAGRPRHWVAALVLQGALSYAPLFWFGKPWGSLAVFVAGSLLLAFRPAIAWPLVGLVMGSMGLTAVLLSQSVPVVINSTVSGLVTGLIVYSLVRLAQLVEGLEAAGRELARASVVQERLRAARDLHDLLGHSLAAILLKCELVRRLDPLDPARARAELDDIVRMAAQARDDMQAVAGAAPELSIGAELESARSVLTAAGIEVTLTVGEIPPQAGPVLSVVLREAVTNVLRHSAARHCRIALGAEDGVVRLVIANDGLDPSAPRTPPGAGIGNLTTRLAAHNGRLSAAPANPAVPAAPDAQGCFRLEAELPVE